MNKLVSLLTIILVAGLVACNGETKPKEQEEKPMSDLVPVRTDAYTNFKLTADISHLSENEKEIVKIMFQVADIMDDIFWVQNYGDKEALLSGIEDANAKKFAEINYGPWDQMAEEKSFIDGYGDKPLGANYYPADMTKEEFDALDHPEKANLYTMIRRDEEGKLKVIWYHEFFAEQTKQAADLLLKAAELAEDEGLKKYLTLRADALLTDKYYESDIAWMDMKTSNIDMVVGPIENYGDRLYGYKAAHEAFILIKDIEWSKRLAAYTQFLPQMQKDLPVDAKYKAEEPGTDVDLNAYSVIYYAGDCNAAGKTLAINLPNDSRVQLEKGTRKLQLKNALQAKFEKILVPIADVLIAEDQREFIQFDAFFSNTMFHEVGHGLGIKFLVDDSKTEVSDALKDMDVVLEEGKADILGLFAVTKLDQMGELGEGMRLKDNYVTFMASIFRSIRFGASSAHGKANMCRFNYFLEHGAMTRNENGTYTINFEKMQEVSMELARIILELQGNGDYEAAKAFVDKWGSIKPQLQADLDRLTELGIPIDITLDQGPANVGL
jgi:hypothetical protein